MEFEKLNLDLLLVDNDVDVEVWGGIHLMLIARDFPNKKRYCGNFRTLLQLQCLLCSPFKKLITMVLEQFAHRSHSTDR